MGYTHYWSFNTLKRKKGIAQEVETKYQLALRQCTRIARAYNKQVKAIDLKHPDRLSGYTAHCKVSQYGGLNINGTQDLSHEDFTMPEHFNKSNSNFCKTAYKPYDIVVVACLITLKYYLGDAFGVSSDGDSREWIDGLELSRQVLKIKDLNMPSSIRRELGLVS